MRVPEECMFVSPALQLLSCKRKREGFTVFIKNKKTEKQLIFWEKSLQWNNVAVKYLCFKTTLCFFYALLLWLVSEKYQINCQRPTCKHKSYISLHFSNSDRTFVWRVHLSKVSLKTTERDYFFVAVINDPEGTAKLFKTGWMQHIV